MDVPYMVPLLLGMTGLFAIINAMRAAPSDRPITAASSVITGLVITGVFVLLRRRRRSK
jgi:hypothetical protein